MYRVIFICLFYALLNSCISNKEITNSTIKLDNLISFSYLKIKNKKFEDAYEVLNEGAKLST